MKINRAFTFTLLAVASLTSLVGCNKKINYQNYADIFANVGGTGDLKNNYFIETQFGSNVYYYDADNYMLNEMKKLTPVKKFTKTNTAEKRFVYTLYHNSPDGSAEWYGYHVSTMSFYMNGSIIVNDYGSDVRDCYNYFTLSKEDTDKFFKVVEDKFQSNIDVILEDKETTKNEKGIDQLLEYLETKQEVIGEIYSRNDSYGKVNAFHDEGSVLNTLKNIDFKYLTTEVFEYNYIVENSCLAYNYSKSKEPEENEKWFLTMEDNLRYVTVYNRIGLDRTGNPETCYANHYTISYEAGRAIYQQAVNLL